MSGSKLGFHAGSRSPLGAGSGARDAFGVRVASSAGSSSPAGSIEATVEFSQATHYKHSYNRAIDRMHAQSIVLDRKSTPCSMYAKEALSRRASAPCRWFGEAVSANIPDFASLGCLAARSGTRDSVAARLRYIEVQIQSLASPVVFAGRASTRGVSRSLLRHCT